MATRQFTGKTVAEATDLALATLALKREEVEIAVVNPGRAGILGFGGEPAVIAVTPLVQAEAAGTARTSAETREPRFSAPEAPRRRAAEPVAPRDEDEDEEDEEGDADGLADDEVEEAESEDEEETAEEEAEEESDGEEDDDEGEDEEPEAAERGAGAGVAVAERRERAGVAAAPGEKHEPDPEAEQLATEILDFFLGTMGVVANTFVREDAPDGTIAFEIEGEDAGLLIGRRGETLQALQFLVNLIVNKQLGRQVYVTIDVEGYRERRQESLRSLAQRTAERVASSGRSVQLQPMPASERRIIHVTLAEHPDVRTESKGDGDQRRVVVLPKR